MSASKRPSTSSLRRFLTSRPYVPVAEIRRRFGLDEIEGMAQLERDGQVCFIGLPDREASKLQDLWTRNEVELELSVEVRAPVVVGIYPMRIARYVMDATATAGGYANGHATNGHATHAQPANGSRPGAPRPEQRGWGPDVSRHPVPTHQPADPASSATTYASGNGTGQQPQAAGSPEPRPDVQRA